MFERPHHQRIAQVLDSFDGPIFLNPCCLFDGDTAVALLHGEFRESVDIDFICSSVDGYRELHSQVPPELMALLKGKDVMVGVIDVASDLVETPEEVADTIGRALQFVPRDRLIACTNCGLAPMSRAVAEAKLRALTAGAALAQERHARA